MGNNVSALPGASVTPELKRPVPQVVSALKDLLAKAEAGEIQAVSVALSGFDSEQIQGHVLAGETAVHAAQLHFQLGVLTQKLQLKALQWGA